MSKSPTTDETNALQTQTVNEDEEKRRLQSEQNKSFDNHGQGVIPEEIWQNLPGKKENL